jgi:hypothetical protein
MLMFIRCLIISVVPAILAGCGGGSSPAKGGTPGTLAFGANVSSDIRVTIHRRASGGFEVLGFANTAADGTFVLYNSGATEPLWLEPGNYAFTLESIGPPIEFPKEFTQPESTPLKVKWESDMSSIRLDAPPELLIE